MKSQARSTPTPERLLQMGWGYAPPLIIEAAVKHRLFDRLEAAPQSPAQLAKAARISQRGVTALCDALVGLRLLARRGIRYQLTPESSTFLVSTKPSFHGGVFQHLSTDLLPRWLELSEIVRSGQGATNVSSIRHGEDFFARFVESLFPLSYPAAQALGVHLGVSRATAPLRVLDLAAGSGVWGIALAEQSPHVLLRAVDWPRILPVTAKIARRHGVAGRLTAVPGDLMKVRFGKNHQIATLGHILHSEGRLRSRQLLKKTFDALAPGGTIAIMEFLVDKKRSDQVMGLLFAVNMLVNTNQGDTYSFEEISGWLRQAGFIKPRLLPVPAVSPLVLATKP